MGLCEQYHRLSRSSRPDSASSWFNLGLLFLFNLLYINLIQILGGAFVAIMDNFDLTREETARIMSYNTISSCFAGIVTGVVSHKFGPKRALLIGHTFGVVGCFGAFMVPVSSNNLNFLSLCFIFYGFSFGFSLPLSFELVARHFVRNRGKAITVYHFSSTLSYIIHPLIYTSVLDTFGLRGSWLFYSCLLVQGFLPLSIFQPPDQTFPRKVPLVIVEDLSDTTENNIPMEDLSIVHRPECHLDKTPSVRRSIEMIDRDYQLRFAIKERHEKVPFVCCQDKGNGKGSNVSMTVVDEEDTERPEEVVLNGTRENGTYHDVNQIEVLEIEQIHPRPLDNRSRQLKRKAKRQRRRSSIYFSNLRTMFNDYKVYAQMCCQMIGGLCHLIFCNTLVDYGMDNGFSFEEASNLYVVMCVGHLISLIPTGWVVDLKVVNDSLKLSLSMGITMLTYILLSISSGWVLYCAAFACGFAYTLSGTIRTTMAAKFGLDNVSTILGFGGFLNGCLQLVIPALIGLCRDTYGSYVYLYPILAISCLTMAVLYFVIYLNDRRTGIRLSRT